MESHSDTAAFLLQKVESKAEPSEAETKGAPQPQTPLGTEKVVQVETVQVEERRVMSVHASGDASHAAGEDVEPAGQPVPRDASGTKGKEGSVLAEETKERGPEAEKLVPGQEETATASHKPEEAPGAAVHAPETSAQMAHFEVTAALCCSERYRDPQVPWDGISIKAQEGATSHLGCVQFLLFLPCCMEAGVSEMVSQLWSPGSPHCGFSLMCRSRKWAFMVDIISFTVDARERGCPTL